MPRKKSAFTTRGRRLLSGKQPGLSRRGVLGVYKPPPEIVTVLVGGRWKTLNIPESAIYRALEDLRVNFRTQVAVAGGRSWALCDFILDDYRINLEFQGPFHNPADDFWRRVAREQAGFMVEYLYDRDLIRIHRRLQEIMGRR